MLIENNLKNVEIVTYECSIAKIAIDYKANYLVRGIRNKKDYRYETAIEIIHKKVIKMDTIYIMGNNIGYVSSTMVMELIKEGKDISKYVPKEIMEAIKNK